MILVRYRRFISCHPNPRSNRWQLNMNPVRLDYESPLELVRRLIKDSLYFPCLLILRDYEETKENAVLYTVGFLHMAWTPRNPAGSRLMNMRKSTSRTKVYSFTGSHPWCQRHWLYAGEYSIILAFGSFWDYWGDTLSLIWILLPQEVDMATELSSRYDSSWQCRIDRQLFSFIILECRSYTVQES
jgi:hypothetical protein